MRILACRSRREGARKPDRAVLLRPFRSSGGGGRLATVAVTFHLCRGGGEFSAQVYAASVNYESNFHIRSAATRTQNSVPREIVPPFIARSAKLRAIRLFAPARFIVAPVFLAYRVFFPHRLFTHSGNAMVLYLREDVVLSLFHLFFRHGRPARVTRGGTRRFRLIVHSRGRFRSRVAFLSLFFSRTARLPSTLTSFSHSAPGDFCFLSHGPPVSPFSLA